MKGPRRMSIVYLLLVIVLFSCSAGAALNNVLLVSDIGARGIYYSPIPTSSARRLIPVSGLALPIAVDYDPNADRVYASGLMPGKGGFPTITSFDSSGGNFKGIRIPKSAIPWSVAVDYLSKLVYYTDYGQHAIWVTSLNLTWHTHLIINTYKEPYALCLDPPNGKLYFITLGQEDDDDHPSRLVEADMDGGNQRVIHNISVGGFRDIAIDSNYLYWTELTVIGSRIRRYSLSTQQVVTILTISLQEALLSQFLTIAIADNYLYVSKSKSKQLLRYSTLGSNRQLYSSVPAGNSTIAAMVAVTQSRKLSGTNGCSVNNGGCHHLCLPRPGGRRCTCDDGYVLQSGTNCMKSPFSNYLIVSDFRRSGIFLIDLDTNATKRYEIYGLKGTRGVTYADNYIYWVDQEYEAIRRGCGDASCVSNIATFDNPNSMSRLTSLQDVEIDSTSGYLYVIDLRKNKITRVRNATGTSQDIVTSNLDDPFALALDEGRGYLFWTDVGASPKIERVSIPNGNNRMTVIDTALGQPADIAVDASRQIIYWCDATRFKIEQASYDGSNRRMVFTTQLIFTSIAIDGNYLYFKSYHSGQIHRVNRFTGTGIQEVGASVFTYVSDMAVVRTSGQPPPTAVPPRPPTTHRPIFPGPPNTTPQRGSTSDFLLYVDLRRKNVYKMGLEGGNETRLFKGLEIPQSIDYDPMKKVLFVLECGTASPSTRKLILVTDIGVTNQNGIRLLGRSYPRQLAIDYISELIYYADRGLGIIGVYTYDLRNDVTLLKVEGIAGIVVDFSIGQIFYNTYQNSPTTQTPTYIYTAGGDGSNPRILITDTGVIGHLALDKRNRMMYWVGTTVIERCTYEGMRRQILVNEPDATAVAVDEFYLYFCVLNGRYLYRMLKSGGSRENLGPASPITGESFITDIHVQKASLTVTSTNQCSTRNGGCSQMCLPTPTGRTCMCGRTYQLAGDQQNCILSPFEKVLLVTDKMKSAIYVIDVTTNSTYPWRLTSLKEPAGIGWYPDEKTMFIVDKSYNALITDCWERRTGCIDVLKEWEMDEHILEDVEVDYYDKYIYVVDSGNQKIFRTTLAGTVQQTIVTIDRGSPRSLALDLTRRLVFWTDIGSSPKIERASMEDGSGRVTVIDTGLSSPNDIVLDPDMVLMYWCDGGKRVIEVASMTGSDRKVLFNEGYVFISLALDDQSLYFFAVTSKQLFRINRWTGRDKQLVGEESFLELFDMMYVDITAPTTMKVNPTLPPVGQEPGMLDNSVNQTAKASGGISQTTIIYIAVGAGGGVVLILIIVTGCVCCCLMSAKKKRDTQARAATQAPAAAPTDAAPQTQAPPTPAQNDVNVNVQPQAQGQYLNPPPYLQPGLPGQQQEIAPSAVPHLLAQQMLQQNHQAKQTQQQMMMMQQQLLLLQAQQLKANSNNVPQQAPAQKPGFHKPPMPLPNQVSEEDGKDVDLYVNSDIGYDNVEDQQKDDYLNM